MDKMKEYFKAKEWCLSNGFVKVRVPIKGEGNISAENLWCKPIEDKPGLLEVCNVPFYVDSPCIDDIIEVTGDGPCYEFAKVVEHIREPLFIVYENDLPLDELKEKYANFSKACRENNFKAEGMIPGLAVVAVLWGTADESVDKVIECAEMAGLELKEICKE